MEAVTRKDIETFYRLVGEVEGVHREFILAPGEHRVGSLTDNEVCIEGSDVSRRHAVLHVNNHTIRVEDLRSTNGTFVNGVQVTRSELAHDDWLQFGSALLTLERVDGGDLALGIALDTPQAEHHRGDAQIERTTQLGSTRDRHARRLALANRVAAAILDGGGSGLHAGLERLREGLGAEAAALLRFETDDESRVTALAGDAGAVDEDRLRNLLRLLPAIGTEDDPIAGRCVEQPTPLLAVARRLDEGQDALVIMGGELEPELVPLCELLLRIFLQAVPAEPEHADRARPREARPLTFPEHHVRGASEASRRLYEQLRTLRTGTTPVLIMGETGVGKEHVVRILHASSDRAGGPLRIVNCAAIPADLLEAELFGIEAGVATGVDRRPGAFRDAEGGILFFDEIGAMPLPLQAKLLRALQNGEVHPVGARRPLEVDVRIVAATNTDLAEQIRAGSFRSDLYYRLAGCEVHVAPLRERREDIPALVSFFLATFAAEAGKRLRGVSVNALEALQNAPWPGNVRQLEHEIHRLVSICPDGSAIESSMVSAAVTADAPAAAEPTDDDLDLKRHVDALERCLITRAIEKADRNLAEAARRLGLSRNGLVMKMGRLGVKRT